MKVFIVIPAYNEENSIVKVLADLQAHNFTHIVVVNDGSEDKTTLAVQQTAATLLVHGINRGMGAALETGNQYALSKGAEIIVHFDADGQMQAKDINSLITPILKNEVDVCLGSRFLSKNDEMPWSKKYVIHPISRVINYLFTRVWLTDAHNGFRALSRQAASKIYISQDRMAHNTEIVEKIRKFNLRYCEVPVTIKYFEYGQSLAGGFKVLKDLILRKLIR
jgi:glycosyltransferase involved in cell wall biosynthesis